MKTKIDVRALWGLTFEGWTVNSSIGNGADGIVYSASKGSEREVALKIYFPEIITKYSKKNINERMELQTGLADGKKHRNLVEVFYGGFSEEYQTFFLIMEKIEGKSLDKLIGQIPSNEIPLLVQQLASVCEFLEENQYVHRDIKPSNIMVSPDFKVLTLLDLGIIHHFENEDRLSGGDFISTLRYCPPEFVWRTEDSENINAWRAITFYQIGAVMYEMIMEKIIFEGHDTPRANLYDAIKFLTPDIQSEKVPQWLVTTAQACLLKDWRERLNNLLWESFYEEKYAGTTNRDELDLKLLLEKSILSEDELQPRALSKEQYQQKLWNLNKQVISDLRSYIRLSDIFPRCSTYNILENENRYITEFRFESENVHYEIFKEGIVFKIEIKDDLNKEAFIVIKFSVTTTSKHFKERLYEWSEIFTTEIAIERLRSSFIDSIRVMLANNRK